MIAQHASDDQVAALAALLSGDFGSYQRLSQPLGRDPGWETFPALVAAAFQMAARQRFGMAPSPAEPVPAAVPEFAERMRAAHGLDPVIASWLLRAAIGVAPPRPDRPLSQSQQLDVATTQVVLLYALAREAGLAGPRLGPFLAAAREAAAGNHRDPHLRTPPQRLPAPGTTSPPSTRVPARRSRRVAVGMIAAIGVTVLVAAGIGVKVALAGPPTAPPGFIAALTTAPDSVSPGPGDHARRISAAAGTFAGPHFWWQFGLVEVRDTTPQPGYPGTVRQAAAGHEFIAIFAQPAQLPPFRVEAGDRVTAAVVVGGSARALPRGVLGHSEGLLVSVPEGQPATLRVTDDGRTQSYDLRTGRRWPDAIPGYYRPQRVTMPSRDTAYSGSGTCPDVPVVFIGSLPCSVHIQLLLNVDSASLQPWLPGLGWARPGRIWLLISDVTYLPDAAPVTVAPGGGSFTLQASKSFTIRIPDGTRIAAVPEPGAFTTTQPTVLAFSVPSGFTRGTLLIHPDGRLIVTGKPDHWKKPPPVKRVRLSVTG